MGISFARSRFASDFLIKEVAHFEPLQNARCCGRTVKITADFGALSSHLHMSSGEIYYQNSCQSRFSGLYLIFEVFQERAIKERLAIAYLVLQACLVFEELQTRVAHICFCLVRMKMPLLTWTLCGRGPAFLLVQNQVSRRKVYRCYPGSLWVALLPMHLQQGRNEGAISKELLHAQTLTVVKVWEDHPYLWCEEIIESLITWTKTTGGPQRGTTNKGSREDDWR